MRDSPSSFTGREAVAAEWLLRLRDPGIAPAEIGEWLAWCEAEAENQVVFDRMQALWRDSGAVAAMPADEAALARDEFLGEMPVSQWSRRAEHPVMAPSQPGGRVSFRAAHAWRWAAAASVAAVAVAIAVTIGNRSVAPPDRDVTISTVAGVNRSVLLPDGTLVTVAGRSSVAVRYSARERHVFLEHGEAFFQVKSDRSRPFIVHALDAKVTAVGTAFDVKAEQEMVRVAVTEGVVDIDRSRTPSGAVAPNAVAGDNIRLAAGHQVTLKHNDPAPIVVSINAAEAIAWVGGTLKFVDEPLASVVAAVNRYASLPVRLEGEGLGELRYTGTVVAGRADEWLRGLPDIFPVVVRSDGSGAAIQLRSGETLAH